MLAAPRAAPSAYLSLASSGGSGSSPVLFGSNPLGDALVSTGVMTLAGATVAVPVLPVRVAGVAIRETLHRFDAETLSPGTTRGVIAANHLGEALGTVTMRWLVAPDRFEATASAPPPHTELDASRSQRFVMQDGVLRFQDRAQSGLRFFGAGRTYPARGDGSPHLLFAGAAVVVEGLGVLKGLRGCISIIGEISAGSLAPLVVTGRFDDGPFEVAERVGLMIGSANGCPGVTVLMLAGESNGGSRRGEVGEEIRAARIDNDLANATRPRSAFRTGVRVGRVAGPLRFDPSDRRCAVRLFAGRRELTFNGENEQPVATIVADALEGTAFRDEHAGDQVSRLIAYGQLSAGTGALVGAGGIMTMDTAVSMAGAASSVYTLWLIDEGERFRAPAPPRAPAIHSAGTGLSPAPELAFVESSAASMMPADLAVLAHAQRTLAESGELHEWLEQKMRSADYRERFEIVREHASGDDSFGFFDVANVGGAEIPVMGIVQEMFYDRQKLGSPEPIREQLAEFVLRYFMRVCHVGEPEAVPARKSAPDGALRRAVSWLPGEARRTARTGYQQLYYQLAASGRIGKFLREEWPAIVDLREIGPKYDWILLKGDTLAFDLSFVPFGAELAPPTPARESTHLLVAPSFVTRTDDPEPGVLGEYGFGYGFVRYAPGGPALLAYGPGRFRAAVQALRFRLMTNGEIRARTTFVVARPDRIAAVDVDPIGWSVQLADLVTFRMASRLMSPVLAMADRLPLHARDFDPVAAYLWTANTLTAGLAENYLGLSKVAVEKRVLFQHLRAHQEMLHRSLRIWRMVPDWTAHAKLPGFCHRGVGC
jgi:hypothetical protein